MKKKNCDFPAYMAALVRLLRHQGRFGTAHVYQAALRRVLDFCGRRPLYFSQIDRGWLRAFQAYLLERCCAGTPSPPTCACCGRPT